MQALKTLDWGKGKTRCVRINDLTTEYAYEDIIEVVEGAGEHLDTIMMTKVMTPADVLFADKLLNQIEKKLKLKHRIGLEALIEEVEGMQNVDEIARSHAAAGMPGVRHGRLLGLDGRHQQERRRVRRLSRRHLALCPLPAGHGLPRRRHRPGRRPVRQLQEPRGLPRGVPRAR